MAIHCFFLFFFHTVSCTRILTPRTIFNLTQFSILIAKVLKMASFLIERIFLPPKEVLTKCTEWLLGVLTGQNTLYILYMCKVYILKVWLVVAMLSEHWPSSQWSWVGFSVMAGFFLFFLYFYLIPYWAMHSCTAESRCCNGNWWGDKALWQLSACCSGHHLYTLY